MTGYVYGKTPGSDRWHIFDGKRSLCGRHFHGYRPGEVEVIVMANRCNECVRVYKQLTESQTCQA
jgi:hypothetical protein